MGECPAATIEAARTMTMNISRAKLGIAISVVAFGFLFPAAYGLIAWVVDQAFGLPPLFSPPVSYIIAGALWLIGAFWVFWAYSYLLFVGGGSPVEVFGFALEPTKQLVTTGPYAYTRNPMVFGLLWIFAGVAFVRQSIGGLILLFPTGAAAAVYLKLFEEPALLRRFGAEYEHYRRHVPLLFPRLITYVKPDAVETGVD